MRKVLAAALLVALVSCGQVVTSSEPSSTPAPKPFHPPSSWALFIGDTFEQQPTGWSLTRLDSATLADAGPGSSGKGYAVASADGSTVAEVIFNGDNTANISIVDARTAQLRSSFSSAFGTNPMLTPDGYRLLVMDGEGRYYQLFDTLTGRQIGSLDVTDPICCGSFPQWIDPTGTFLYGLVVPGSGLAAKGPGTPVLVRYDFRTGKESGRLSLKGVQAGVWAGDHVINGEHVARVLGPGAALSPDGSQLAILYQNGTRLMLVDPLAMRIISSRSVVRSTAATSWLRPLQVEAKYEEGIQWSLAFSPDGSHVVGAAWQLAVDQTGAESQRGVEVRLIDVPSARLLADVTNADVQEPFFAPDGSALYGMAWHQRPDGDTITELLRLDKDNLAVAAKREFSQSPNLLILAR